MSEINLGIIGEIISSRVDESVERRIARLASPLAVLRDFEGAEVLTLDEVCRIFRCDDKNGKERVRDACRRGELPFMMLGRDYFFPKRQIAEVLMGVWKRAEQSAQAAANGAPHDDELARKIFERVN